jgi:hypothetical protein
MMKFSLLLLLSIIFTTASAQKKTYYLLAYAQKEINLVCGTKVMINNAEVSLSAEEAKDYQNKYKAQIEPQYNAKNGYKNLFVELFSPGTVVNVYEGERKYEQRRDGWDCTSTYYGFVKGADNLSVDNQLARLKSEYKFTAYNTVKRWGTPALQSDKTDDLGVRWVQGKTKVVAFITNTRKEGALKVTIRSFKSPGTNLSLEGGFQKARQVETFTAVLNPGGSWTQNLDNADGFEIDTAPAKIIKEEQGIINNIKERIRLYITDPKGTIAPHTSGGKRG